MNELLLQSHKTHFTKNHFIILVLKPGRLWRPHASDMNLGMGVFEETLLCNSFSRDCNPVLCQCDAGCYMTCRGTSTSGPPGSCPGLSRSYLTVCGESCCSWPWDDGYTVTFMNVTSAFEMWHREFTALVNFTGKKLYHRGGFFFFTVRQRIVHCWWNWIQNN